MSKKCKETRRQTGPLVKDCAKWPERIEPKPAIHSHIRCNLEINKKKLVQIKKKINKKINIFFKTTSLTSY